MTASLKIESPKQEESPAVPRHYGARVTVSICDAGVVFDAGNQHVFRAVDQRGDTARYAADGTIPKCPQPGECWEFEFIEENYAGAPSRGLGAQRRVLAGNLLKPTGEYLVGLLAHHPAFRGLGIGPMKAQEIYAAHGTALIDLLDGGDFKSICGISESTAWDLCDRWRALAIEPEVMKWFDRHNLPYRLASRIHQLYGAQTIEMLEENPYCLHAFLPFGEVDGLATLRMGVAPDHPNRLVAAVENVLYRAMGRGHTAVQKYDLLRSLRLSIGANAECAVALAVQRGCAFERKGYVQATAPALMEAFIEQWVADSSTGHQTELAMMDGTVEQRLASSARTAGFALNAEQQSAVLGAFRSRAYLICGGAGVGKTTVLRLLAQLIIWARGKAVFMAVAGRASRRIAESLGPEIAEQCEIRTVAAYLAAQSKHDSKLPDGSAPWLIVDEASMLDLHSAYWLLAKSPVKARLVLVGDPAQLPPVGCGLVFHRMVDSGKIPRTELVQVYRQSAATGIPAAAAAVRQGTMPTLSRFGGAGVGLQLHPTTETRVVEDAISIAAVLGRSGGVQILTLFKNALGARDVNLALHRSVALSAERLSSVSLNFAVGEPVIFRRNATELNLQNGSMGRVVSIQNEAKSVTVRWDDGRELEMKGLDLWDCDLAHGITTHKSQGSQFDRVVIMIPRASAIFDRSLLYTAITRARLQAVLVGDAAAIRRAIESPANASRRNVLLM